MNKGVETKTLAGFTAEMGHTTPDACWTPSCLS
jgi:hypothetical protein